MSIAAVVTRGYGGFGSIAEVVARGYIAGAAAVVPALQEPRGSTREDQRHRHYDFGEHYPHLRKEEKDRIDRVIAELRPKQRERLAKGRPSKSVRKKIAEVLPEYLQHKPKPQAEYLEEIRHARIMEDRTQALLAEEMDEDDAIATILLLTQ